MSSAAAASSPSDRCECVLLERRKITCPNALQCGSLKAECTAHKDDPVPGNGLSELSARQSLRLAEER